MSVRATFRSDAATSYRVPRDTLRRSLARLFGAEVNERIKTILLPLQFALWLWAISHIEKKQPHKLLKRCEATIHCFV